jgi:hypothetical protein
VSLIARYLGMLVLCVVVAVVYSVARHSDMKQIKRETLTVLGWLLAAIVGVGVVVYVGTLFV